MLPETHKQEGVFSRKPASRIQEAGPQAGGFTRPRAMRSQAIVPLHGLAPDWLCMEARPVPASTGSRDRPAGNSVVLLIEDQKIKNKK